MPGIPDRLVWDEIGPRAFLVVLVVSARRRNSGLPLFHVDTPLAFPLISVAAKSRKRCRHYPHRA
jgi:hypothetical protein